MIIEHTTTYAAQKNKEYFNLTEEELYTFIGILLLSGYVPLPRRRMYWEQSEDVHNVLVANAMRRSRFEEICSYLHMSNNETISKDDKLGKIRPLIDCLNRQFLRYAPIENNISIDEFMLPYYCRHGCKQFVKGKPVRFGYKAWVAALKLGYCVQFEIYQGRKRSEQTQKPLISVPKRLQKIRMTLQRYNLDLQFVTGKENITADALSRAPLPSTQKQNNDVILSRVYKTFEERICTALDGIDLSKQISVSEERLNEIRKETVMNPCLVKIKEYILTEWSNAIYELPDEVKRYNSYKYEHTSHNVIGQPVMVQLNPKLNKKWTPGKIEKKLNDRSYIANVEGKEYHRNAIHVKSAASNLATTPVSYNNPIPHHDVTTQYEDETNKMEKEAGIEEQKSKGIKIM
ncbi:piggyBac transposable element-derived protein 1-like [Onthophagus taurus]|uniref:piggyBac transposable element-derived protein 1-like n=1 Tax=Onthophagus taurus TaxID=166361 RepID=UPI0039BEADBD